MLQAIDYIRSAYRTEDRKYRQAEKQPLPVVYFFKNQGYIDKIFPNTVARNLRAAGRAVETNKPKSKVKPKKNIRAEHEGTKQAEVLALLRRSKGATTADICKTTGWTQHSVHGFLTALRKQERLTAKRVERGTRVYRIAA